MANPFVLFDEKVKLQLNQFNNEEKIHYLSYISEIIKDIIRQRNRFLVIFISVILIQYLYVYEADVEVKISSIHIKEEIWIEILLFIFGWAVAIRLGLLHLKYVATLTIFEHSLNISQAYKDLYLFAVTDNNAAIHYITKIGKSNFSRWVNSLHAFTVIIIYIVYSYVYANGQSRLFYQLLDRFEESENTYYMIYAVGLTTLLSLTLIGILIFLYMLSRSKIWRYLVSSIFPGRSQASKS